MPKSMKWVDTHSPPIQPKRGEVKYHLALSSVPGLTNFVQLVFTALCVQQLSRPSWSSFG